MLRVPEATSNGAKVPIVVEMAQPMTPEHHVTSVRVRNDDDPISSKGTFHFTPANGRVYLAFQARMHEGRSEVTRHGRVQPATARCPASRPIEIPADAGGCTGGAAPAQPGGAGRRHPRAGHPHPRARGARRASAATSSSTRR